LRCDRLACRQGRVSFLPLNKLTVGEIHYPQGAEFLPMVDALRYDPKYAKAVKQVRMQCQPSTGASMLHAATYVPLVADRRCIVFFIGFREGADLQDDGNGVEDAERGQVSCCAALRSASDFGAAGRLHGFNLAGFCLRSSHYCNACMPGRAVKPTGGAGEKVDRRGTLAGGYQDDRKSQMKLHRSVAEHSEGLAQKEEQRRDMRTRLNQADTDITKLTSEVRLPAVRLFALIPRGQPEAAALLPSLPWLFR
jgi:hypothetical protein